MTAVSQPVTIQRQPDGRHAVMDAQGNQLGQHNSVFSAARQIHEYYGGGQAEGSEEAGPGDIHPPVPHPSIPRPPKTRKPKPDAPKPIPKP